VRPPALGGGLSEIHSAAVLRSTSPPMPSCRWFACLMHRRVKRAVVLASRSTSLPRSSLAQTAGSP